MGDTTLVDTLLGWQRDTLERCNGVKVGQVVSYSDPPARASVQLTLQGRDAVGTRAVPPVLPSVPVLWPRFAGMRMQARLNPGDEVVLLISDRALDRWLAQGGIVDLESDRTHHVVDALALPWICTAPRTAAPSLNSLVIGRDDGLAELEIAIDGTAIRIDAATVIRLGTLAGAVSGLVMDGGGSLQSAIDATIVTLNAITGVGPDGPNVEAIAAALVAVLSLMTVSTKVLGQPA